MNNIKNNNKYEDTRGSIEMIMESCNVGSISRITSGPNTRRADHYHLNDGHTIIINEGQILMYERKVGSSNKPKLFILNKGDIHFTDTMIEHLMYFPCHTIFDCYSLLPRNSENYEKETIRINHDLKKIYENI